LLLKTSIICPLAGAPVINDNNTQINNHSLKFIPAA